MRRVAAILFAFLLASTAFGQQKNAFSVFYNDPSYWFSSSSGGHAEGGVGVAVSHAFSPIFSTELSIARESYTLFANQTVSNGMISYDRVSVRTTPIDGSRTSGAVCGTSTRTSLAAACSAPGTRFAASSRRSWAEWYFRSGRGS